jgi:LmbE family N-acetylglucosaminyl deacetylase
MKKKQNKKAKKTVADQRYNELIEANKYVMDTINKVYNKIKSRRTLIIAPHPDDDCLGCFHQLYTEENVDIIYVSSGKPEEAQKREAAVQSCMVTLRPNGKTKMFFLKEGDRKLNNPAYTQRRIQDIILNNHYDAVFYPAYEGGHPLHDEIAKMMKYIETFTAKVYEYSIYGKLTCEKIAARCLNILECGNYFYGYTPKLNGKHMIHILTRDEIEKKYSIMNMYRKLSGENSYRLNDYEEESCKRVR